MGVRNLRGGSVILAGAASGTRRATAPAYASIGAALCELDASRLEQNRAAAADMGVARTTHGIDVSDEAAMRSLAHAVHAQDGAINDWPTKRYGRGSRHSLLGAAHARCGLRRHRCRNDVGLPLPTEVGRGRCRAAWCPVAGRGADIAAVRASAQRQHRRSQPRAVPPCVAPGAGTAGRRCAQRTGRDAR